MTTRGSAGPDSQALCTVLRHARRALCQRVSRAAAAPAPLFADRFPALVAEVEAGLRHEELTMKALGMPGLRERRQQNGLILSALRQASTELERGRPGIARAVVGALRDLLCLHRHAADLALAMSALRDSTRMRLPNRTAETAGRPSIAA